MRQILVLVLLVAIGCGVIRTQSRGLELKPAEREKVVRQYVGRDFVLASSVWVADFFGQKTELFADARPFDILELYRQNGERLPVSVINGDIVPAGTAVKVREILFPPDGLADAGDVRMTNQEAPTAHTWVIALRSDNSTPLVFVLPREMKGTDVFASEMEKRFATQAWMTSWLNNTDPGQLAKVFQKQVEPGMSRAAMLAALGEPRNADEEREAGGLDFVADYGDLRITLQGSMVAKVLSLKAEAEEARRVAEEKATAARLEAEAAAKVAAEAKAIADAERKQQQEKAAIEREAEAKRATADAENKRKEAELQARLDTAKRAKEDAELEKTRRVEGAKAAKAAAKAEAEATEARKKAEIATAKAEAEARAARAKADEAAANAELEASAARRKLEEKVAVAEREAEVARQKAASENEAYDARRRDAQSQLAAHDAQKAPAPSGPRKVGVKLAALTKDSAFDLKLTQLEGALIVGLTPAGAAENAGMRANDVILAVDGKTVRAPEDFTTLVGTTPHSSPIRLSVWRSGAAVTVTIPPEGSSAPRAATSAPARTSVTSDSAASRREPPPAEAPKSVASSSPRKVGVKVASLTKDSAAKLERSTTDGAQILGVSAGGFAESAGLRVNDVVLAVDGKTVRVAEDFTTMVGATPRSSAVRLSIWRSGASLTLTIPAEGASAGASGSTPTASAQGEPAKPLMPSARKKEKGSADGL
jgi:C-terminal processing protease CtpA/Prc